MPNKVHYKVSEAELLYVIGGSYKITKAKVTKTPPKYEALDAELID